jgi:translation initiation factor 2 subunit 3
MLSQIKNTEESMIKFIEESMINQPVITIGMIGHVSNGKSETTKAISGTTTQRHTEEKITNRTTRLGYANAKIYKCTECKEPECYQSSGSNTMELACNICNKKMDLITHVSFTDCPGHNCFMSKMLNGTCSMDYAILIESCANDTPAPQTIEHYMITKEIGIQTAIICLNKADLLLKTKNKVYDIIKNIKNFIAENESKEIPIIPISATMKCNIDVVLEYIAKMKIPKKDLTNDFKMLLIRSFNVNHPRTKIEDIKGGVIGGTLQRGIITIDDNVIIYPGHIVQNDEYKKEKVYWKYCPLKAKILSINTDKNKLKYAIPGGQIGVQLNIDPCMTRDDILVGQVIFSDKKDVKDIKIFEGITVEYKKLTEKYKINKKDIIQINVNSNNIEGKVFKIDEEKNIMKIGLEKPICVEINDIVTLNVLAGETEDKGIIHIFGKGKIIDGNQSKLDV